MSWEARRVYTLAVRHGGDISPVGGESPNLDVIKRRLNRRGTVAARMRDEGYEVFIAYRDLPEGVVPIA